MKHLIYLVFGFVFTLTTAFSQDADSLYMVQHYDLKEYRIPMRDGIELFTVVYTPKDKDSDFPILMNRTCYNASNYKDITNDDKVLSKSYRSIA